MPPAVAYVVGVPLGLLTLAVAASRSPRPATSSRRTRRRVLVLLLAALVTVAWAYLLIAALIVAGFVAALGLIRFLVRRGPRSRPHRPAPWGLHPLAGSRSGGRGDADYWDHVAREDREQRLDQQHEWDMWQWGNRTAPPPGY